ncbi:hypothetical protein BJ878DRAFT_560671 [Calycina marina]|uniref:Uncharacterized protein n=1 Tax=Calycina marina TaxID=1763456 RepID=A0A9P7YWH6_9HELO|nr:hypothetical protein BJ878DRAFT_560671 [Calycina marina]
MSYELDTKFNMNEQYSMYAGGHNPPHRSPSSNRTYHGAATINRQPSQHFDEYAASQQQRRYQVDDHLTSRYDSPSSYHNNSQYEGHRMMAPPMNLPLNVNNNHSPRFPYDNQTWNGFGGQGGSSTVNMVNGNSRSRARLTPDLFNPPAGPNGNSNLMPTNMDPSFDHHQQYGVPGFVQPPINRDPLLQMTGSARDSGDDALIPTAIVIKNIPFAIKKEQLMETMSNLGLPLPYAFNYHFDNGVFRGLAFANFTTADETAQVIERMNHMELSGRKLRVEYKKMLPIEQRERIERDKRERRGQLQEQHQPASSSQLHAQSSMTSMNSGLGPAASPSPLSQRANGPKAGLDFDLNDPTTQDFYNKILLFKNDKDKETYVFPHNTDPEHRRIIHVLAHNMNLDHRSEGTADHRQLHLTKKFAAPPVPQIHSKYGHPLANERKALTRAATTDLSEARDTYGGGLHTLNRQTSSLLHTAGHSGDGLSNNHSAVRGVKSFAELRSWTHSPHSTFPPVEGRQTSRYAEHYSVRGNGQPTATPSLTPTSDVRSDERADISVLTNGVEQMSFNTAHNRPSMGRSNGSTATIRPSQAHSAGPIGSQRPTNGNYDDNNMNGSSTLPQRQPTIPGSEWGRNGGGFVSNRANGHANRGSGEQYWATHHELNADSEADTSDDSNGVSRPPKSLRY